MGVGAPKNSVPMVIIILDCTMLQVGVLLFQPGIKPMLPYI